MRYSPGLGPIRAGEAGRSSSVVASPTSERDWEVRVRWRGADEPASVSVAELRQTRDELPRLRSMRELKDHPKSWGRLTSQPVHSLGRSFLVESRHEAIRLVELDFERCVDWVVPQPVSIRVGRGPVVTPDFLYGLRTGQTVLENVRVPARRDERFWRGSQVAKELAASVGWAYSVAGESIVEYGAVLERLGAYARVEPRRDVVRAVAAAFVEKDPWRLGELMETCAGGDPAGIASVFALLWRRVLRFPLAAGLSAQTVVTLEDPHG